MAKKVEKKIVWTTKKVQEAADKLNDGYILPNSEVPFFEKTIGLRKKKITFGFTGNELDEYTKCKIDVTYFANNYCFIKVEDGSYRLMNIRDYQYGMLDLFDQNKYSILMASRQVGKCASLLTVVDLYHIKTETYLSIPLYKFYYIIKKRKSVYDYLRYAIYYLIDKLDG